MLRIDSNKIRKMNHDLETYDGLHNKYTIGFNFILWADWFSSLISILNRNEIDSRIKKIARMVTRNDGLIPKDHR